MADVTISVIIKDAKVARSKLLIEKYCFDGEVQTVAVIKQKASDIMADALRSWLKAKNDMYNKELQEIWEPLE